MSLLFAIAKVYTDLDDELAHGPSAGQGERRDSIAPHGALTTRIGRISSWPNLLGQTRRELHRHLAAMPVFADCSELRIAELARWGDVVEVGPGAILVREDRLYHWFYVVLSGSLQASRGGVPVREMDCGAHFGEAAMVGFGPQPSTVTAVEPSVLFVLGRRYLLTIASVDHAAQRVLFPGVAPAEYPAFAKDLIRQGHAEWQRLTGDDVDLLVREPPRRVGRSLSLREAVARLASAEGPLAGALPPGPKPSPSPSPPRRYGVVLPIAALLLAALGFLYHPPLAVVTAGTPIDVTQDISVTGAKVERPTGRYLLTWVRVNRQDLAHTAWAKLRGRQVVSTNLAGEHESPAAARRLGRQAFLDSHLEAVSLAERMLDLDGDRVTVSIRDRGFVGPSAGLVYALALVDMLDPADLARGRTIAATGGLDGNGRVTEVGFVSIKGSSAHHGHAEVFVVPASQAAQVRGSHAAVWGVRNLQEAINALRDP